MIIVTRVYSSQSKLEQVARSIQTAKKFGWMNETTTEKLFIVNYDWNRWDGMQNMLYIVAFVGATIDIIKHYKYYVVIVCVVVGASCSSAAKLSSNSCSIPTASTMGAYYGGFLCVFIFDALASSTCFRVCLCWVRVQCILFCRNESLRRGP